MKIRYDPDADAMYITLKEDDVEVTKELDKNTLLDLNKDGEVVGIELLFLSEKKNFTIPGVSIKALVSA